ncbi:MAG: hypothetical protein WD271_16325 [Acidimicrobiia bacterium]
MARQVARSAPAAFDVYHPGNVSPLVAWLAMAGCPVTRNVFSVNGGEVHQFLPWHYGETIDKGDRRFGRRARRGDAPAALKPGGRAPESAAACQDCAAGPSPWKLAVY